MTKITESQNHLGWKLLPRPSRPSKTCLQSPAGEDHWTTHAVTPWKRARMVTSLPMNLPFSPSSPSKRMSQNSGFVNVQIVVTTGCWGIQEKVGSLKKPNPSHRVPTLEQKCKEEWAAEGSFYGLATSPIPHPHCTAQAGGKKGSWRCEAELGKKWFKSCIGFSPSNHILICNKLN